MAVVPGRSILSDLEVVGQFLAGSDGTLGHARDAYSIAVLLVLVTHVPDEKRLEGERTILPNSVELSDAVPVDRGAVVRNVVGDMNDHLITGGLECQYSHCGGSKQKGSITWSPQSAYQIVSNYMHTR